MYESRTERAYRTMVPRSWEGCRRGMEGKKMASYLRTTVGQKEYLFQFCLLAFLCQLICCLVGFGFGNKIMLYDPAYPQTVDMSAKFSWQDYKHA